MVRIVAPTRPTKSLAWYHDMYRSIPLGAGKGFYTLILVQTIVHLQPNILMKLRRELKDN